MDSASALSALRARGRHCIYYGRGAKPWLNRVDNRCFDLANKFWHHRKGSPHRDRGSLYFTFCFGVYLLACLVGTKEIALAHVGCTLDLSWLWLAGERTNSPDIFLWHCRGGALASWRIAKAFERAACYRIHHHDVYLRRVGDSLYPNRWRFSCRPRVECTTPAHCRRLQTARV